MRLRIIPLFFAVLFLLSISSCSLPSKTSVTTARCLEINSHVEQIPTLVELSVDSVLVKIDSCWTDSLFHQTLSIKNEIDNLIGRALDQHNGDVFVLPICVWEKQGVGFLRTEHYLSVTGYIGRYKKFRTATLEDIKAINEYKYGPQDQQPDAPLTAIYLGRTDLYGGRWSNGDSVEIPVKIITKKAKK